MVLSGTCCALPLLGILARSVSLAKLQAPWWLTMLPFTPTDPAAALRPHWILACVATEGLESGGAKETLKRAQREETELWRSLLPSCHQRREKFYRHEEWPPQSMWPRVWERWGVTRHSRQFAFYELNYLSSVLWFSLDFSNAKDGRTKKMLKVFFKSKHCTEGILTSQIKSRCLKLKHINYVSLKISYICDENLSFRT